MVEDARSQGGPVRQRRANATGGRQHRHVVKVTVAEEALLAQLATEQGVTVPRLLVEAALSGGGQSPTERRQAIAELFRIYRLLGSIANNVNQMARATNVTGQVHPDLVETMRAVRRVADRVDGAIDGLALP